MSNLLLAYLLPATAAGGLLCLLGVALHPLWRRLGAGYKRAFLLACALLFLLPFGLSGGLAARLGLPALQLPAAAFAPAPPPAKAAGPALPLGAAGAGEAPVLAAPDPGAISSPALTSASAPAVKNPIASAQNRAGGAEAPAPFRNLAMLGVLIYLAGFGLVTTLTIKRYAQFTQALKRSRQPEKDEAVLQQYQKICEEYGLRRPPALYRSPALRAAALTGLCRPAVYLPDGPISEEALAFCLRHELAHYRHRDLALKWAVQAVCSLHWFNPLAFWLNRAFGENCEGFCDECVTKDLAGEGRLRYAQTLLAFASSATFLPRPLAGFASPANALKQRMQALLHPAAPTRKLRRAATGLLGGLVLLGLLAGFGLAPVAETTDGTAGREYLAVPPSAAALSGPAPSQTGVGSGASAATGDSRSSSMSASSANALPNPATTTGGTDASQSAQAGAALWPISGRSYDTAVLKQKEDTHRGIDIAAERGTPIVATQGGKVTIAENHKSYGNYVLLDHGDGLSTLYAHCDSLLVNQGQTVAAGEEIATVGATGNTLGNVLHFEVQQNGQLQNPLTYLNPESPEPGSTTGENATDAADGKSAVFLWPVPDYVFSSRGGGPGQNHRGRDINAPAGSSILAVAAGEVVTAGWHYSYGNHILIQHPSGLRTLYAHCESLLVEEGQTVEAGQQIATVGSTGYAEGGSHLHLEVQNEGGLLNPDDYLPALPHGGTA